MCFENEGDWYVGLQYDETKLCESKCRCIECRRVIEVGESTREIYQQEHESCQCEFCLNKEDPDPDYDGPSECRNEIGETFFCHICPECCKILEAIKAFEVAEGCPPYAQQPMFGELHYVFSEHEQAFDYAQAAVDAHPELYSHKLIVELIEN